MILEQWDHPALRKSCAILQFAPGCDGVKALLPSTHVSRHQTTPQPLDMILAHAGNHKSLETRIQNQRLKFGIPTTPAGKTGPSRDRRSGPASILDFSQSKSSPSRLRGIHPGWVGRTQVEPNPRLPSLFLRDPRRSDRRSDTPRSRIQACALPILRLDSGL